MKDDKYLSRKFLNKKEGVAIIQCLAEKENGGEVYISDCTRGVTLDFWHYRNKKNRDNHLSKLNLLIEELIKFREYLTNERD